jgi:hypothetical protein
VDVDPDREWFYSVTFHGQDGPFCGVITQGNATTRDELTVAILYAYGLPMHTRVAVHSLERNDL